MFLFTSKVEKTWGVQCFSQEGEDMILSRIFEHKDEGFYVDVGAHHPKRFSNTYLFYKKGWTGINIDAMPGSMKEFRKMRPKDINIEVAIAKEKGEKTFYVFNEPAFNSFDEALARSREIGPNYIADQRRLTTKTLKEVLLEHSLAARPIDFLTIDVEGLDLEVLQSNDWQLFRPHYVLVECFGMTMDEILVCEVYKLLTSVEYVFYAKTVNTVFFKDITAPDPAI
jgi:FkbM family methyltransferase